MSRRHERRLRAKSGVGGKRYVLLPDQKPDEHGRYPRGTRWKLWDAVGHVYLTDFTENRAKLSNQAEALNRKDDWLP